MSVLELFALLSIVNLCPLQSSVCGRIFSYWESFQSLNSFTSLLLIFTVLLSISSVSMVSSSVFVLPCPVLPPAIVTIKSPQQNGFKNSFPANLSRICFSSFMFLLCLVGIVHQSRTVVCFSVVTFPVSYVLSTTVPLFSLQNALQIPLFSLFKIFLVPRFFSFQFLQSLKSCCFFVFSICLLGFQFLQFFSPFSSHCKIFRHLLVCLLV